MFKLILFAIFATLSLVHAAPNEIQVVSALQARGFQCAHRSEGSECTGWLTTYPERIAVLIPRAFNWKNELIVHLHGWVLGIPQDSSFDAILTDFDFLSRLKAAGYTSGLMIVPSSRGHCETYETAFASPTGFQSLMSETLLAAGFGVQSGAPRIVLSGHSGAFVPMSQILLSKPSKWVQAIRELYFFDATYSALDVPTFTQWTLGRESNRLRAVFRTGTSTEKGAKALWQALTSAPFSSGHSNLLPTEHGEITPSTPTGDGADHWGTVRVWLPDFLKKRFKI